MTRKRITFRVSLSAIVVIVVSKSETPLIALPEPGLGSASVLDLSLYRSELHVWPCMDGPIYITRVNAILSVYTPQAYASDWLVSWNSTRMSSIGIDRAQPVN
jgi:hypothetical protein